MPILDQDMQRMVSELRLCYVATVTPDGKPNLSPKASLCVIDGDHLAFADIMSPGTIRNLKSNPHCEINVVDPFARRGYRFKGTCEVVTQGDLFDLVANELWKREGKQCPVKAVVNVTVDTARPLRSPAYVFNKSVTEQDLRTKWLARFGVKPIE